MLSEENNERLTRVGPKTPMGQLMREYWIPALLSSELPAPDCAPVRVMLLCEKLIAFRDSKGRVGLFPEACPHRGASLFFGRNEECGLRCAYHGWKFDVSGACVSMPTMGDDSPFRSKVRARSYPCVERGGLVWTYMGPSSVPPPGPPELDVNVEEGCRVDAAFVENNWLQSVEANIDLAHTPHLHADSLPALSGVVGDKPGAQAAHGPPEAQAPLPLIEVADTPAGFSFAYLPQFFRRYRTIWVGQYLFPFYANLPYGKLGSHWITAWVPMDDTHTMTFAMWNGRAPQAPLELLFGPEPNRLPNTADWFGRFRLVRNGSNDFGLDRDHQRARGGPGVAGQATQDAAITWSMGPILDRTQEHLDNSDLTIIHLRKRLLDALSTHQETGAPGREVPGAYRVQHGSMTIKEHLSWRDELVRLAAGSST